MIVAAGSETLVRTLHATRYNYYVSCAPALSCSVAGLPAMHQTLELRRWCFSSLMFCSQSSLCASDSKVRRWCSSSLMYYSLSHFSGEDSTARRSLS